MFIYVFTLQYRDRVFWFPHNMDFRGRVYPTPPHLNHLSSDSVRSILQFARGEKLGPKGLRWLKVCHIVNLTLSHLISPLSTTIYKSYSKNSSGNANRQFE